MGLYNFEPRFEPAIRSGRKQHTIRADRKYPDEPGDTMHGYVGLRHPGARLLFRWPCVKVERITIQHGPNRKFLPDDFRVFVEGQRLDKTECEGLAYHDGFDSFAEMMSFWHGRLPFKGSIIHWKRGDK